MSPFRASDRVASETSRHAVSKSDATCLRVISALAEASIPSSVWHHYPITRMHHSVWTRLHGAWTLMPSLPGREETRHLFCRPFCQPCPRRHNVIESRAMREWQSSSNSLEKKAILRRLLRRCPFLSPNSNSCLSYLQNNHCVLCLYAGPPIVQETPAIRKVEGPENVR